MKQKKPSSLAKGAIPILGLIFGGPIGLLIGLLATKASSKMTPENKQKTLKFLGTHRQEV